MRYIFYFCTKYTKFDGFFCEGGRHKRGRGGIKWNERKERDVRDELTAEGKGFEGAGDGGGCGGDGGMFFGGAVDRGGVACFLDGAFDPLPRSGACGGVASRACASRERFVGGTAGGVLPGGGKQ